MDVHTLVGQQNSVERRPGRWSFAATAEAEHLR
jgi:hypothetical protein